MKINISKATEKEIKRFNRKEWRDADIEYFGRPVKWVSKALIFKAREKDKIVGLVIARYDAGVIYIDNLIVSKYKRGQGIGRKLMDKIEKTGRRLGAHKLYLYTMEKWASSKFYRDLGFKKTGDLKKHYLKKDFVVYTKLI